MSRIINCPECGAPVSHSADECRRCGTSIPDDFDSWYGGCAVYMVVFGLAWSLAFLTELIDTGVALIAALSVAMICVIICGGVGLLAKYNGREWGEND